MKSNHSSFSAVEQSIIQNGVDNKTSRKLATKVLRDAEAAGIKPEVFAAVLRLPGSDASLATDDAVTAIYGVMVNDLSDSPVETAA